MRSRPIELSADNREEVMVLPINPGEFEFTAAQLNQKITLLNIGEVSLLGNRGLIAGSLSSFFPASTSPLYRYADREPRDYLRLLEKWKDGKKPIRVIVGGTDFNLMMSIDSLAARYREGDGDIYFTIALTEYRKLNVPAVKEDTAVKADTGLKERPDTSTPPKTYTVVKGDSLWAIAARMYGSGALYTKIYEANKSVIGADASRIIAGQQLVIPA